MESMIDTILEAVGLINHAIRDRTILHVDMNAFFASVEALSHPEVDGKPMAVCGDPENRRGIILAKNEIAKRAGVKTAETIWSAKQKCPDLILLPPHHDLYVEYSVKANEIYGRFTDLVECAGIDESYLDITGSMHLFGGGEAVASRIRETVREELKLTVSVGVSFCKIFAKLGSDYKKPDAQTLISRENYKELLYPLPVTDLMFVGRATAKSLETIGVTTIGQLAALSGETLVSRLGKHGKLLYTYAQGLDNEPVRRTEDSDEVKSIGNGMTFKRDLVSMDDIHTGLLTLSESVGYRLRKRKLKCCGIQVAIKDPFLKTIDRQKQLQKPTHITREIYEAALELVKRSWRIGNPIRLLTVNAINLVDEHGTQQLTLFGADRDDEKQEALNLSTDKLKKKYGRTVVKPAAILKNDLGIGD